MSAGTSEFFCLICLLVCSCTAQTTFGAGKITAELGQDVILPCKFPKKNIKIITAVEWIRPHQDPDHVLLYRDGRLHPDSQHPSYQNRVDLQDKEMTDGNFSLILKDVMKNDTGRYKCQVYEIETNNGKRYNWWTETTIYLEVHAQTNITAELGQDVILPCKVPNNNNIRAVEWIRPHQDPDYVLFYRYGLLDPYNQHPSYQNRVDLQDKDMKDGNFSMILKNVTKNDTGRYECRLYEEEEIEPISIINIINLVVHLSGEKFEGDQDGNIRDGGNKTGIIVGPVVGVIVLLSMVSLGFL